MSPCALCPRARRPVKGDGPSDASVVLIGSFPGKDEDERDRVFVGRTGRECNETYLPLGGLNRDNVYFTNAGKCWPQYPRQATDEIAMSCAGTHLRGELAIIRPKLIVLLGATACSLLDISVEMDHGRPRQGDLFGFKALIWPMLHPAAGLHDYAVMANIIEDWKILGKYIRNGELPQWPVDEYPNPEYHRLHTRSDVLDVLSEYDGDEPLAIDTEYDPLPVGVRPYCLTFSLRPGTGWLIKASDREAVGAFCGVVGSGSAGRVPPLKGRASREARRGWRGPLLLHNAVADLPPLAQMGLEAGGLKVVDSMVLAYLCSTLPQGLKVLAYRLCGMKMVEFNDLVEPNAVEYWLAYMQMLAADTWPTPEPYMRLVPAKVDIMDGDVVVGKETQMVEKLYKPQDIGRKVKRLLGDYEKSPTAKVFGRWDEWGEEKLAAIKKYGDMPAKSITMVTDESALLNYSVRDADATLRIYPVLRKMLRNFRKRWSV